MMLMLAVVTAGIATAAVAVTIGLVALIGRTLRAVDGESGPEESDGTDSGPGGGGGGSDRPGPRSDRGGDPAWWPEFERELTRYVARRERDRTPALG
jgi:hypothetical protein